MEQKPISEMGHQELIDYKDALGEEVIKQNKLLGTLRREILQTGRDIRELQNKKDTIKETMDSVVEHVTELKILLESVRTHYFEGKHIQ